MKDEYIPIKKSTLKKVFWCLNVLKRMIGYHDNPDFRYVEETWEELVDQGAGGRVVMSIERLGEKVI